MKKIIKMLEILCLICFLTGLLYGCGYAYEYGLENIEETEEDREEQINIRVNADDAPVSLEEKLAGCEQLTKLTIFVETGTAEEKILDYDYLSNFPNLQSLTIHDENLSDISFVTELCELYLLDLRDCSIKDVTPVSELDRLLYLYLSRNQIYDVSPFAEMNLLMELELDGNPLEDPGQLGCLLEHLQYLNMDNTGITDITSLSRATFIKKLSLKNNQIANFDSLGGLVYLTDLDISGNPVESSSVFLYVPNTKLYSLADCEKEPWKQEIDKALNVYNPIDIEQEAMISLVTDCGIGDFNGDGIADLGMSVWWCDYSKDVNEKRFYLYPGNGNGYDQPLEPLVLQTYLGQQPEESIMITGGKVYFYSQISQGSECEKAIRVMNYKDGVWGCEVYSCSRWYTCFSEESDKTILGIFESADFSTNQYKAYFYIDDNNGFFHKYIMKKNKLTNCISQSTASGENMVPVIIDYYPKLPDFTKAEYGFRLAETLEEREHYPETALDKIIKDYYSDYPAQKIYYDRECINNLEGIMGIMLPEYFYRVETEEGTISIVFSEECYATKYIFYAYLNGDIYEEYVYNQRENVLMLRKDYDNLESVW